MPVKTLKSASARGPASTDEAPTTNKPTTTKSLTKSSSTATTKENQIPNKKDDTKTTKSTSVSNGSNTAQSSAMVEKLENEINSLKQTIETQSQTEADLRTELEGTEKERDFYFEKLRDIETMLQDVEDKGEGTELTARIFKILYATADGFESVSPDADVIDGDGEVNDVGENLLNASLASEKTAPLADDTF